MSEKIREWLFSSFAKDPSVLGTGAVYDTMLINVSKGGAAVFGLYIYK